MSDDDEFPMASIEGSSAVIAAGWKDGHMRVTWRRGQTYDYEVGEAVYVLLLNAPSKGRFMQSLLAEGTPI